MSKYKHNNCKVWIGDLPKTVRRAICDYFVVSFGAETCALFRKPEERHTFTDSGAAFDDSPYEEVSIEEFFTFKKPPHTIRIDDGDPIDLTDEQFEKLREQFK